MLVPVFERPPFGHTASKRQVSLISEAMTDPARGSQEQFQAAFQQQREFYAGRTEIRTVQGAFFEEHSRKRREPPTPVASGLTTPQEGTPVPTDGPVSGLVVPTLLEDETAFQVTAGELGADVNNPQSVQQVLAAPVHTAKDVLRIVRGYHKAVVRPEMYGLVLQLESALLKVNDAVFSCRRELAFMTADNRSEQKRSCGLLLVTTGWPNGLKPEQREFMIGWMIEQLPEAQNFLRNRGFLREDADHTAQHAQMWFNILNTDPTTVPQGTFWSGMTMLHFKSWDLRQAFLKRYGGQGGTPLYTAPTVPITGKHVRVSPCSPQWQRKLEMPLRVVISVLNAHPDTQGKRLIILWKSLTIMEPVEGPDFQPDHTAWCRLFYEEAEGSFQARLETSPPLTRIMHSPPTTVGCKEKTLFAEHWNTVIWGTQFELDEMERIAYRQAKHEGHTAGKGTFVGKSRKHWSNVVLHNSYFSPYPFELQHNAVEQVAFVWDELCQKMGVPEQQVGDIAAATYQGKPVAPDAASHTAAAEDVEMERSENPFAKAPPPTSKGAGKQGHTA